MKLRSCLSVLLILCALTIGIILLGYGIENWRGARAWQTVRRELQAKGESLDWQHFIPPPVPDDQNLAMAPLFAREIGDVPDLKTGLVELVGQQPYEKDGLKELPYGSSRRPPYNPPRLRGWSPRATDPAEWTTLQRYFRRDPEFPHREPPGDPAADVLLALTRYQPILDELARAAETRPLLQFPTGRNAGYPSEFVYPYLGFVQRLASTLCLRASAELAMGRSTEALRDIELSLRLGRGMAAGPTLTDHLSSGTIVSIALTPVWRGLAKRCWSPEELSRLQTDLTGIDLLTDDLRAVRAERADHLAVATRLFARADHASVVSGFYPSSSLRYWLDLAQRVPLGWIKQNVAFYTRVEQRYLLEAVDPSAHRVFPEKARAIEKQIADSGAIYGQYARACDAQIGGLALITAHKHTGVDQALVACALERFALDHKGYPTALSDLVPVYLDHVPNDLINGAPLSYVQTPDGRFRLYSVGWDGGDDGGQVVWDEYGRSVDGKGDWPWQYEPTQPPPADNTQRNK